MSTTFRWRAITAPWVLALLAVRASASPLQVTAVVPFGPAQVAVAFSDSVDIASALLSGHYALAPSGSAPPLEIQSVVLQENQRMVVLTTRSALPISAAYQLTVTGVTSRHGDALASGGPFALATPATAVMGIADVHANINDLIGKSVTVIGEVYIRAASVTGTPSGYIQDGTGRGLNVFGTPLQPPLDTLGTVVLVTGTAALYYTTVELTGLTVTTLASGLPRLAPKTLSVAGASSAQWEGTYIEVTAQLAGAATPSGSNHYNYPATDGTLAFYFRVRNSVGVDPSRFAGYEIVTGAGAGSNFQGVYQITVGVPGEFYQGVGRGDITPPVLVSASGEGGDTRVRVMFSEPVGAGSAVAANYALHPTGSPASPIAINGASPAGGSVTLALASPLVAGTDYTIAVSRVRDQAGNEIPAGMTVAFTAATPLPYQVAGAFRFGAARIAVAFTGAVNATAATQLDHYTLSPALALADARLQENGRTVILRAAAPLRFSTTYQVTVSGVPSATGEALRSGGPFTVDTGADTVVDIADIQANVSAFAGRAVTIVGQVTIPVGSRGSTPSGYIEDGSGHGINLFGNPVQGPVNQLGSVAKVTGVVTPYFTTTEVTTYTATALATGMPHLAARRLTIAQTNDPQWEGTYIETGGTISAIATSGTTNITYDVTDGLATVTFRVGNGLGIPPGQFQVGDRIIGRGAGGSFQSTYQINVGNLQDFALAGAAGPDTVGPRLLSATGDDASPRVLVTFDEPVSAASATLVSNYGVSAAGGPLIHALQAVLALNGRSVLLTLEAPLTGGVSYTLTAGGIEDLLGNVMVPGAQVAFTASVAAPPEARLTVPARTLVRGMSRQGEVMSIEAAGTPGSKAAVRVFDLGGRLVRVLFDGRLPSNGRRPLTWDARDESFEYVPAGLYVCHLVATSPAGTTTEARAPIVVAVRLK